MLALFLPPKAMERLLIDSARRDRTTARRVCILRLLFQERYLTREQIIARVEAVLGKGCFGSSAWKDTFYRDMRVVKTAFQASDCKLAYSRKSTRPGYYLVGQPAVCEELTRIIAGSVAEMDPAQIAVLRKRSIKERIQLGLSISETARKAVAYRIKARNPDLSAWEANKMAVQRAYLEG